MSRYNNIRSIVNLTIKINDKIEYIVVLKSYFDDIIKIPSQGLLPWEHIYDITIADKSDMITDEYFLKICDAIGDFIMTKDYGDDYYIGFSLEQIHVLKFIDKYVIPHVNDLGRVQRYLRRMNINMLYTDHIQLFPDVNLEYTPEMVSVAYNKYKCSTVTDDYSDDKYYNYEPTGTLSDAYMVYKILNEGKFCILSHVKWFRTLKVLLVYFNLDHIITIYKKTNDPSSVSRGRKIVSKQEKVSKYKVEISDSDEEDSDTYHKEESVGHKELNDNLYGIPGLTCINTRYQPIIKLDDDYQSVIDSSPAYNILYVMLKSHVANIDIPESETLITNMNDFLTIN